MDITKFRLKEIHGLLIKYLKDNDFSTFTIKKYDSFLADCLTCYKTPIGNTYEDLLFRYLQLNPSSQKSKVISTLGRIKYFDINKELPTKHNSYFIQNKNYLCSEFQLLIDNYTKLRKESGIKESTIYTETGAARRFFSYFQKKGVHKLSDIKEADVLELFINEKGEHIKSYSYMKSIRAVLKENMKENNSKTNNIKQIIFYLPALKQIRKNIQYLEVNEIMAITSTLSGNSNLSKRDKAIGLLALKYGLRNSDIINLTLFSIDFKNEIITVNQQKTGVSYILKLITIVGNAILDYVKSERPKSKEVKLFLRKTPPYKGLEAKSAYSISLNIMKESGIRTEGINRKGFHLFRHNLATTLLGEGVKLPIISSILGHVSPASTETYLSSDFVHLRQCALDISVFSQTEEILDAN